MIQGEFSYYSSMLCCLNSHQPQLQPRCFLTEINTAPAFSLAVLALPKQLVRWLESSLARNDNGRPAYDSVRQRVPRNTLDFHHCN